MSPLDILREAIRQVPAVKYALGVAGIAAAAAIIVYFVGTSGKNIILIGLVFVGMILLFLFAALISSGSASQKLAGEVLVWGVLIFFLVFLVFTTLAMAFGWPCNWAELLSVGQNRICPQPKPEPTVYKWRQVSDGDCNNQDTACSPGLTPKDENCNQASRGTIAVCFPGTINPSDAGCGKVDWCTYKSIRLGLDKCNPSGTVMQAKKYVCVQE